MEVRSENGVVLARAARGVQWQSATIAELDRSVFPMLAGICPYADTVFNSWQRPMLLEELERLPPERQGPWIEEIRAMCRTAEAGQHRYVWFLGD